MKKAKPIIYEDKIFEEALRCFEITTKSYHNKLEKLNDDDFIARNNRIRISVDYKTLYSMPVLFLKVLRVGSKIGEENFYSYPLPVEDLELGKKYEIEFFHFDAFNLPFNEIIVSIISKKEYLKRQLNANAVQRGQEEIISICPA